MKSANLRLAMLFALVFSGHVIAADSPDNLRIEAEKGDAVSAFNLGTAYLAGNGVTKDPAQAAMWMGKAADQGLAEAQDALGIMYLSGNGVEKDPARAAEWIRKAAVQGHHQAQADLAVIYFSGMGIPADKIEGAAWLIVEADSGDEAAKKERDQVLSRLGSDETVAVKRRSMELRTQIENTKSPKNAATSLTGLRLDAIGLGVLVVPLVCAFCLNRRRKRVFPDQRSFFWGYCFGSGIVVLTVLGAGFFFLLSGLSAAAKIPALIFFLLVIGLGALVIGRRRWAFIVATVLLFVVGLGALGNSGNHPTGNAAFDAGRGLTGLAVAFVIPVFNLIYVVRKRREFRGAQLTSDEGPKAASDSNKNGLQSAQAVRNINVFAAGALAITGSSEFLARWRSGDTSATVTSFS